MPLFMHATMRALAILFVSLAGCHAISDSPSLAPSLSVTPTVSPSATPSSSPSSVPTVSAAPSTLAPTFPPVVMGKFEWDLERIGEPRFEFTESLDFGELMIDYNASLRDFSIDLFQVDCVTPVSESVAKAKGIVTQTGRRHVNLTVSIDVVQQNVTSSSIWTTVEEGEGLISICSRVDLYNDEGTSVHFHEQILHVTINLLQGFSVGTVDLSRDSAEEDDGEAQVDFQLVACQCNTNFECLSPILTQGSDALLCVQSFADGVEILGIQALSLSQGSYSIDSIVDGETDEFTVVTIIDEKALIRNQILSVFFEQYNPEDVVAEGLALLGFTDDSGRRRFLRANIRNHLLDHAMEEEDVAFRVPLPVKSSLQDNSSASIVSLVASFMSLVVAVLVGYL